MTFRELAILLPCHSLEDFPLYHTGDDADSLLACWTALWHPALIAAVGSGPKWHRVDLPPEDLTDKLLLVPTISTAQLPTGFAQRAKDAGALLIRQEKDRQAILTKALARLEASADPPASPSATLNADLVQDFLALGWGYLQIQVLTRQMRYSSNLDETHFFNQLVAGARAAVAHDHDEARAKLAACFDLLGEERDHYYSVDAYLLDLTLVADTTLGETFRQELAGPAPVNVLLNGQVLDEMATREPESLQCLSTAIQEGRAGIAGGEASELPLPLLSCEAILAELRRGSAAAQRHLAQPFTVFARRRFGLTPVLPGILEKLRYAGAIHSTLDEGHFPSAPQVKTRWQGVDTGAIDALAKPPLDATKPETFLNYAQKLGESMDSDHVATLSLAHWPQQTSVWYDDLRRCTRYTSALGKFLTLQRYFEDTYRPGSLERFDADRYKSPYLKQWLIRRRPDPISSSMRHWRRRVAADLLRAIHVMASAVRGTAERPDESTIEWAEAGFGESDDVRDGSLPSSVTSAVQGFSTALPRAAANSPGLLVVNPFGFTRRMCVTTSMQPPTVQSPVIATGRTDEQTHVVVDVPPMGYAFLQPGPEVPTKKKSEPPLAEDDREKRNTLWLRNEFFEISLDPVTGTLKSLNDYRKRRNRLSQQLALRFPGSHGKAGDVWRDPDETAQYSVMAADEIQVVSSDSAVGVISAKGRLLDREGQLLAHFTQTYRVVRGSRVLRLQIELDPVSEPTSDGWNSYYACRLAWPDEEATIATSVNETRQVVRKQRLEAPLYVDVDSGESRLTLLTGGVPFHRRVGARMLDSLLIVRGERERRFELGIGIDLPQSLPEALALMAPPTSIEHSNPPSPPHSWLFHLDTRSIVPTHWSLLVEDGVLQGVRVRLLESTGRSGRFKLSSFRPFASGRQVDFTGAAVSECPVTEGRLSLDIGAHEWIEVEGRWNA